MKNKFIVAVFILVSFFFFSDSEEKEGYSFRNEEFLKDHYAKHGVEMGYESEAEYEKSASDLVIFCKENNSCLYKKEEDNDDIFYLEKTNEIVFVSSDGYIRTYFLPDDGIAYFNRQ